MALIKIVDLEVHCHIGVTEQERSKPQRLLVTVEMSSDIAAAARSDKIEDTIDYYRVAQDLIQHCNSGRSWCLVETLATEFADLVRARFQPKSVSIEIKKFPIPEARYVAVSISK